LDVRHLTIPSPPSGKYDLEIVTEIHPQKNTSLEVNEHSTRYIVCFFIALLFFLFNHHNLVLEGRKLCSLWI